MITNSLNLNILDMIWVLICSALIFLMQAGFLCLEAGLTQTKNSINVAMKNLTDFAISSIIFWMFGFGIMFGDSQLGWLGQSHFFVKLSSQDPWLAVYFLFQVMFCGTAVTIISGGVAERMRFFGYLIVVILTASFIYPLFGHWVWGGNFIGEQGWLQEFGFIDFAGSTVVHSVGGWVTLATLIVVGNRQGRFDKRNGPFQIPGNDLPMAMLGVLLLWFGWIGFNGGSNLHLNENVAIIIVNTILSACAGLTATLILGWRIYGYPDPLFVMNGALAGLVSITASCFAVDSLSAIIIGAIGGMIMLVTTILLDKYKIDDAIGAVPVHVGAGVWGTLAVALYGDPAILGTGLSWTDQLLVQLTGISVCFVFCFGSSYSILKIIHRLTPLRVSEEYEKIGLNISEHKSVNEIHELLSTMRKQAVSKDLSVRSAISPFSEVGQIAEHYNLVMDSLEDALGKTEAIVLTAKDAILTFGKDGYAINSMNPSAENIFGYKLSEVVGRPAHIVLESGEEELMKVLANINTRKDSDEPLRVIAKRKDETLIPMELSIVEARLNGKVLYTATFHDISQRGIYAQQLEIQAHELRYLNENLREQKSIVELIGNVATIANEAASIEQMMSKIMAFVADYFNWPIGHVYLKDRENKNDFHSTGIWYASGPIDISSYQRSKNNHIERAGETFIGKAIAQAVPQWSSEIPKELGDIGEIVVKSRFAFPVMVGNEVHAVIEFFTADSGGMTDVITDVMSNLMAQLGLIFERRAVLSKLSESEQVFRSICSLAHDPIIMMDDEGKISYWNQAAEHMFGYTVAEAIGRDLHELLAPARYYEQVNKAMPHFRKTGQGPIISKAREVMAKKKNGEEILVEISISAVQIRGRWHAIGITRALSTRNK